MRASRLAGRPSLHDPRCRRRLRSGHGSEPEAIAKEGFASWPYRVSAAPRTAMPVDASPAAQADAHLALMDALGIDRAVVLGVSAGAPSAMQLALRHPDRCQSSGRACTPWHFRPKAEPAAIASLSPMSERLLMFLRQLGPGLLAGTQAGAQRADQDGSGHTASRRQQRKFAGTGARRSGFRAEYSADRPTRSGHPQRCSHRPLAQSLQSRKRLPCPPLS